MGRANKSQSDHLGDSKTGDRSGWIFLVKESQAVILRNIIPDKTLKTENLGVPGWLS